MTHMSLSARAVHILDMAKKDLGNRKPVPTTLLYRTKIYLVTMLTLR